MIATVRRPRFDIACMALLLALLPRPVAAQTGVSDDRVAVPDGPGSVEGLGDNASVSGNMGVVTTSVPIDVPAGFPGLTPDLSLSYSSGGGASVVGIGWAIGLPSIERLTLRGLPRYDGSDEFAAGGSEQLVRVATDGDRATYRARFERGFVRYRWYGVGGRGYWTAEYPDGRVATFGATADGTLVVDARLEGPRGQTFRYHLVEVVDSLGHSLRYDYARIDGVPHLVAVRWAFASDGVAHYHAELAYEPRPDPISDGKPGFEERQTRRLAAISTHAAGGLRRRHVLRYEAATAAVGRSRLASVETFGRDGARHGVAHRFWYSRALDGVCDAGRCDRPFVVDMGSVPGGLAFATGDATLVDLDGDSLPDLVDSSAPGRHRIFLARLDSDGHASFATTAIDSATATREDFRLGQASVQVVDVDGDGFADLANSLTRQVLCNDGSGDWVRGRCSLGAGIGFDLEADSPGDPNPRGARFLDVDGDRRIDVIRTVGADVVVHRNTGAGFEAFAGDTLGRQFDVGQLELADLNGDGLLDPAEVDATGQVRYRLHLGNARWTDWVSMPGPALPPADVAAARLEDIDADGLDDLVLVIGDRVRYALNRSGQSFGPMVTLSSSGVDGPLPVVDPATTTVLFADMNGSGSRDVVWVERGGRVRYLELFPVPPHLLSRIENGIGSVETFDYSTSIAQRLADDVPWQHRVPYPMNVIARVDRWVTLTGGDQGGGLHEVTEHRYRDPFYDSGEKLMRGFVRVETRQLPDTSADSQDGGQTIEVYDVGADDPYRAGLLLTRSLATGVGDARRPVRDERLHHADCPLAEIPTSGLRFAVRFVCETGRDTVLQDGAPAADWVTVRSERRFDGYGQVTLDAALGVVGRGPDRACGAACNGDEAYVETEYVVPGAGTGGRWILGRPHTVRRYARPDGIRSEDRAYYDGDAFVGLALGQLTAGVVTRTTARRSADSDQVIDTARRAFDSHGNVVIEIDPAGTVADADSHRRAYQYDRTGLRVVRTDLLLRSAEGMPYRLRREYGYEPVFDQVSEATSWLRIEGGVSRSARNATQFRYDSFGRRIAVIRPGDSDQAPTASYQWELGDPASRVIARLRSQQGAAPDVVKVQCMDGRGRTFQDRVHLGGDRYQVSGLTQFNARGAAVRVHQPYLEAGAGCATEAPADVPYHSVRYDAVFRELSRTLTDGALYGAPSVIEHRYLPLRTERHDADDTDDGGLHAATPTVVHEDGLGRMVAVERLAAAGGAPIVSRFEYDDLGHLSAVIDGGGHRKQQDHDLLGRVLVVDDPSSGRTRFDHDPVGNLIRRTDARGVVTEMAYDGANRMTAVWDAADRAATEIRLRHDAGGDCRGSECSNGDGQLVAVSYPIPAAISAAGDGGRGVDRFGFDARGQRIYQARAIAGIDLVTRRELDNLGRELAVTHPDGRRIVTHHDPASRPVAIDGVLDSITYTDHGLAEHLTFSNGAETEWSYDVRRRPTAMVTRARDGSIVRDASYRRDRADKVEHLTDGASAPGWPALATEVSYDALSRVTAARYQHDGVDAETQSWTYDANDNLLSSASTLGTGSAAELGALGYDPARPNRLVSVGDVTIGQDAAGYDVHRGDLSYRWDFLGRMTGAARGEATIASFSYGAGTSRVARIEGAAVTLYASQDFELRDGIAVAYARLGSQRVARFESDRLAARVLGDPAPVGAADGVVRASDAWVSHAADAGLVAAGAAALAAPETLLRSAARRLLLEAGDGHAVLHHDHLGSITGATDADGAIRGRRRFLMPDGDDRQRGFVDGYGFSGQEEVPSLGLVRFAHRWLDPRTRRWTQADPAFERLAQVAVEQVSDATNRYAYVHHDFLNQVDPLGLTPRSAALHAKDSVRTWAQSKRHDIADAASIGGGWEGWAQVELARHIRREHASTLELRREERHYGDRRRTDLSLVETNEGPRNGTVAVELKVQGTDRDTAEFLAGVKDDVDKLTELSARYVQSGMQIVATFADLGALSEATRTTDWHEIEGAAVQVGDLQLNFYVRATIVR